MENLSFSLNVVLPLFVLMVLGFVLRRVGFFSDGFLQVGNKFGFKVTLPVLLFQNIRTSQMGDVFNGGLIAFTVIAILLTAVAACAGTMLVVKDNRRRGAVVQGIFRSNFVLFGVPLALNMFGESALGVTSMLVAVVIPLFNVLAVILLTVFAPQGDKKQIRLLPILKGIITNPLIIGVAAGLLFSGLRIPLPQFLNSAVEDVAAIATPLALIVLGGQFELKSLRSNAKALSAVTACRLLVVPGVILAAAALLGYRGPELGALLVIFASPTAVSSYIMAENMGSDGELAGQIVVSTTLFSVLTMFVIIYLLKALALI